MRIVGGADVKASSKLHGGEVHVMAKRKCEEMRASTRADIYHQPLNKCSLNVVMSRQSMACLVAPEITLFRIVGLIRLALSVKAV